LLTAIRERGHLAYTIDDRPPPRGVTCDAFDVAPLGADADPRELERSAARLLRGLRPMSIMAGETRGIVAASLLRGLLGVPGLHGRIARMLADRYLLKRALRSAGIACPEFTAIGRVSDGAGFLAKTTYPVTLRSRLAADPRTLFAEKRKDVMPLCERLLRSGAPGVLAEATVPGKRVLVEMALAKGQPIFEGLVDIEPEGGQSAPSSAPVAQAAATLGLARRTVGVLGLLRGWAGIELVLTVHGAVVSGVRGTPPDASTGALLSRAWHVRPWELALEVELGKQPQVNRESRRVAVLRPIELGHGVLRRVSGLDAARGVKDVAEVTLHVAQGDRIGGENRQVRVGRIVAAADNHVAAREALKRATGLLELELEPFSLEEPTSEFLTP
jgi:hypothetical protein